MMEEERRAAMESERLSKKETAGPLHCIVNFSLIHAKEKRSDA